MDCRWLMETTIPILLLKQESSIWTIETCNAAFSNLIHLEPNQISGKSIDEIARFEENLSWVKRYNDKELALIHIDDAWFEIEILQNENYVAFVHHNLTSQVEVDNSNKQLQTRLNQIQRIANIGDWEHNYLTGEEFWSDEVYRIMGFRDKTIQPNVDTFMRFVHPDDLEKVSKAHAYATTALSYEVEYRIITIDGHTKWIITKGKVDIDTHGKPTRLYGTMQDITERKRLEQRIEQAFTVAEDAFQSKSQFLAMISHEVRTPINGILGMSQLMKNTMIDDEQAEYVDDIMFSADALLNIIEDILEMSKMESNMLVADSEEFDLHLLMRNIVRMYQLKKSDKPVRFIHRIDPKIPQYVWGDATKIQQILVNILGNAFKFTEKGRVVLTARVIEDAINQSKIVFEIEDTGIGISESQQKEIFSEFHQGDASIPEKYGGSGLGLAISKNYAELMDGYIFVDSELGKGTKFTFALTLEKSKALEVDKNISVLYSKMKAMHVRVLVVEDDEINRNYFSGILQNRCGFKVDFAEDLNSVISALEHNKYQFIIMDTHLKGESGIFITKTVRESMKLDGLALPIVAVTADVREETRTALLNAGVSYFIEKPVEESVFMEIIHQILDMSAVRKRSKTRIGYRYIKSDRLGLKRLEVGKESFESKLIGTVHKSQEKISRILAAAAPLNILVLSHEIDEIDDVISSFGTDDICESLELIKSALLNDDTAGMEVIITDFMDEYQCFVDELQDFITDSAIDA